MNLICFPHYTCGGLLCDILSNKMSPLDPVRNAINSFEHSIGKIGDSDSVFENFDPTDFFKQISDIDNDSNTYIGTHCWPGNLDISRFDKVICVTTETWRSRVYRWARVFYHYYIPSEPWQLVGLDLIDKQRETAKNYIQPFRSVSGAINIEFSDVVDNTLVFRQLINGCEFEQSLSRWQKINNFLYQHDFWSSVPLQRYHEAEYEINLNQRYVYE